jgi:hypothetical protein
MFPSENCPEYRVSEESPAVDVQHSSPIRTERTAPELATNTNSKHISYVDFVKKHKLQGLTPDRNPYVNRRLDSEKWHGPYAQALMESDPAKLGLLIPEAERAILNRYLELCSTPATVENNSDLQDAVCHLSKLKKTTEV